MEQSRLAQRSRAGRKCRIPACLFVYSACEKQGGMGHVYNLVSGRRRLISAWMKCCWGSIRQLPKESTVEAKVRI